MSERNGYDLVKKLRQRYLECGICTEVYDEDVHVPKLLPCLHTFCIKCISTIHKGNSLTCPLCNQMHNLNKGKLLSLPKDNTRRDLTDFLLFAERTNIYLLNVKHVLCEFVWIANINTSESTHCTIS